MNAREELEQLAGERGYSLASLSGLIDRNPAYLQQYVRRGTPRHLADRDVALLASFLGVAESRLTGRGPDMTGWVRVPRVDARAAGGAGALGGRDKAIELVPFDPRFLRSLGVHNLDRLTLIRVTGDSMAPTLVNGDEILVDGSIEALKPRDGVFVLRMHGALIVKRLAMDPTSRTIAIRSDNPAYPSWENCDPDEIDVIGRVVWAARAID